MTNDSTTGGFLAPSVVSPPTDDADLDAILQATIVGIVNLDGTLVRPRWQPVDPKQPAQNTNWCAIGVVNVSPDDGPAIIHIQDIQNGIDIGQDELQRSELLEIMASFYGPNAYANASLLRDGLSIGQNREALFTASLLLIGTDRIVSAPELINNIWTRRADITFHLRRLVVRTYPIRNIAEVPGTLVTDDGGSASFDVTANS